MFKKMTSMLLVVALSFSLATTAFADTTQAKFLLALKTTYSKLEKENRESYNATNSPETTKFLLNNAYQLLLDMKLSSTFGEEPFNVGFNADMKIDNVANKMLSQLQLDIKQLTGGSNDIVINAYADENQVAVNLPAVSDKYYTLKADTTTEEWNAAPIGQLMPADEETFATIHEGFNAFTKQSNAFLTELPEDLTKPYQKLTTDYINKGKFASQGKQTVETQAGPVETEKLSCVLTADVINAYIQELANTIEADEALRGLLDQVYASYNQLSPGYTITDMVIDQMANSLRGYTVDSDLTYTLYVNKESIALRQTLSYVESTTGDTLTLGADFVGKDALINKMVFFAESLKTNEKIIFTAEGNHMPKDGKVDSVMTLAMVDGDTTTTLFNMTYDQDLKATADNFHLNLEVGSDLSTPEGTMFTMMVNGDIAIDDVQHVYTINLNSDFTFGRALYAPTDLNVQMNITIMPTDSASIAIPADKSVNVIDLTTNQLANISEKASTIFE